MQAFSLLSVVAMARDEARFLPFPEVAHGVSDRKRHIKNLMTNPKDILMITNFDASTSDEEMSAWAESDAPIVALSAHRAFENSAEADSAFAVFR